ncbi:MAG: lamin tail domain-containing protein, partial [Salinibacter sp.]
MRRLALGVLFGLLPGLVSGQPSPGAVVINELLYAPVPSSNELLELYNRSDSAVALHDLAFADADREYVPVSTADTTLGSGEYVVLVRDAAAFEAGFPAADYLAPDEWAALNNGGDTLYLRHSPSKSVLD